MNISWKVCILEFDLFGKSENNITMQFAKAGPGMLKLWDILP